jgi:hemolysin III
MAGAGVALKVLHPTMSRALSTRLYCTMGWIAGGSWLASAILAGSLNRAGTVLVLIALAGVLHTAGALVYVRRRPDWWPAVFGYHELFHALVVLGNAAITICALSCAGW